MKNLLLCAGIVFVAASVPAMSRGPQAPAPRPTPAASSGAAFVKQYCVSCHNQRLQSGGLALDRLDPASVGGHAEVWE
jgi:hypothetical protein